MPRDSVDFEPELGYFRSMGTADGAVRVIRWEDVTTRLAMLRQILPNVSCLFDLSSEADPLVVERLRDQGVSFSAAGAAYLERMRILDVPSSRISLTAAAPSGDAMHAAKDAKVRTVSVGSLSALQSLIKDGAGGSQGWQPTLQIVVKITDGQSLVNPRKLDVILDEAKRAGFSSFGLSVVAEKDLTTPEERKRLIDAVSRAASSCAQHHVTVDCIQILGGLADHRSLRRMNVELPSYLEDLSQTIIRVQAAIQQENPKSQPRIEVEAGQLLLGHFPTCGVITNVKKQRGDGVLEVFTCLSVYGDLAGHLFHKEPVSIEVLSDPAGSTSLSSRLVDAVIHGGTCDSIDSLYDRNGRLVQFAVPENLRGGCLLVVYGKRLHHGATDFNQIPPARVVIHDRYDDREPYKCSALSDFQGPQFEAAREFWASETALRLKTTFRETRRRIDNRQPVNGRQLGQLVTDTKLRQERYQMVAGAFLERFPSAQGTVTLLDLETYAVALRNTERYVCEVTVDGYSGVDEVFWPTKTFSDPIGLLCQAATGRGVDAASAGEIWMAMRAGFNPKKMIVSHPHKTPETLRMICDPRYAPWAVTIDSEQELDRLVEAGLSRNTVLFIRYKATGANVVANLSAKFGMPVESERDKQKILHLLELAHDRGFKEFGWAFHVGTQSHDKNDYRNALKTALQLTKMALALPRPIKVTNFNIGGGVCDERVALKNSIPGEVPLTAKRVLAGVGAQVAACRKTAERLVGAPVRFIAEPGRVTCALAGFMMSQVVAGREADFTGARICLATSHQQILSGNVHDESYYDLLSVRQAGGGDVVRYQVCGSSNRPDDIFPSIAPDGMHLLPADLRAGDWLMAPEAGIAYGWNASGSIDGIDPGRFFAFYFDDNGCIQFIESPWSRREHVKNQDLKEFIARHGSASAPVSQRRIFPIDQAT
jgi:diaminopimelate decarboxylase